MQVVKIQFRQFRLSRVLKAAGNGLSSKMLISSSIFPIHCAHVWVSRKIARSTAEIGIMLVCYKAIPEKRRDSILRLHNKTNQKFNFHCVCSMLHASEPNRKQNPLASTTRLFRVCLRSAKMEQSERKIKELKNILFFIYFLPLFSSQLHTYERE
jgi:hypothetical protein